MSKKLTPLKNKLWKIISEYIRRKYADENGMVFCVTCGTRKYWREVDAGHYICAAQGNATRWLEINIHCQCRRCNGFLEGNRREYNDFMIKTYGQARVDELRALSGKIVKMTTQDYENMIAEYSEKLSKLKSSSF